MRHLGDPERLLVALQSTQSGTEKSNKRYVAKVLFHELLNGPSEPLVSHVGLQVVHKFSPNQFEYLVNSHRPFCILCLLQLDHLGH